MESSSELDSVAVEEPLQIRVNGENVAITMRTPGHDRELAAGFLFTEALIAHREQLKSIDLDERGNAEVAIDGNVETQARRNFYITSSCGICGKASIDALLNAGAVSVRADTWRVSLSLLFAMPAQLRLEQAVFERTGGLHAAGLFSPQGKLMTLREDVGRHNAVDKLIGTAFLENLLPLHDHILMLSGRISFELVQKAVMAGIPVVAAVGAPSSLAIETAMRFGITLVGFLRDGRCNIYTHSQRVAPQHP
ncbi:MAG: formate dehydrogenase accessory sulfurtransferase FdhD [Acidobacteriia bacterium]|nr:formate dehydrogenase accessory sulfurtransferase FdhD [Terriglobia bacterium]